jgi:hypothetical protein
MFQRIRHYFKRKQALRLFADKFLFEPVVPQATPPAAQPQTVFMPQPPVPSQSVPMQTTVSPVPPVTQVTAPTTFAVDVPPSPREEIIRTLEPLAEKQAKMDVINRRLK